MIIKSKSLRARSLLRVPGFLCAGVAAVSQCIVLTGGGSPGVRRESWKF